MIHINSRKKTKFKSIVIGKKTIEVVVIIVVAAIIGAALWVIIGNISDYAVQYFYKSCYRATVPYISASDKDVFFESFKAENIEKNLYGILLKQIPCFYALGYNEEETEEVFNYANEDIEKVQHTKQNEVVINTGKVEEHTNSSVNLDIKNETTYELDKESLISGYGNIDLASTKKPQILIVHTHGSESYTQSPKYNYSQSDYARCQDIRYNVVRVGEELYNELTKRGFNVIHDKSINDYPSYNNSYNKTMAQIEKHLKENPTIKCVFDVHRDAIMYDDETKLKLTKTVNGEKAAQIMIVCGSDASGLENPKWRENLGFALKIQSEMEGLYPGLMRPLNLRKERFNMHETTGSLLFEFGTHGNTLDEALASVKYLAEGIEKVLKK